MKKVLVYITMILLIGFIRISDAWWGGQVRKNGNQQTPAGYAKVTAYDNDKNPWTWANAQGWYVLDRDAFNGGMVDGKHYTHIDAKWYDQQTGHIWGGWRNCPVDTFHYTPHYQNQHINVTYPPTQWSGD